MGQKKVKQKRMRNSGKSYISIDGKLSAGQYLKPSCPVSKIEMQLKKIEENQRKRFLFEKFNFCQGYTRF